MVETHLMHEKLKSYDIKNCTHEDITKIIKDGLEKLSFHTRTAKLGKNIIKINYYDELIDENLQRNNKILILQDPYNDCHINFKGKLNDVHISELWRDLTSTINNTGRKVVENTQQLCREDATYMIIDMIEKQGFEIETLRAIEFIENFQNRYGRLPYENEILPIVKGYILTQSAKNEEAALTSPILPPKLHSFAISSPRTPLKPIQSTSIVPKPGIAPETIRTPTLIKTADYIKPNELTPPVSHQELNNPPQSAKESILSSKPIKSTPNYGSNGRKAPTTNANISPVIINESSSGMLTIQKPIGRRICPNCGNRGEYKIHELIDKSDLLCLFPRLYGKKYSCDGCKIEWKENS
ncbi:MAG: hypothetical protein JW891_02890 [Candidatus Lokiarchaeota archaeon]|nr:hypothetical protein [Candidatus Lokiarchaeota archaeon]